MEPTEKKKSEDEHECFFTKFFALDVLDVAENRTANNHGLDVRL